MQVYFTCIQISISLFHTHPCTASLPSRSEVSCLICIHVTSPPFKSWHLDHNSIHVLSHTNPRFDINAWTPSRSRLTSIQVPWLAFQPHPVASQFQPGPISTPSRSLDGCLTSIHAPAHLHSVSYSCIPPPSTSCLTSTQVLIFASHLHPCCVSSPGGEMRDLQLSSIHVPSMDKSLNNPLQFLHLILFSITYRHSKSLCVYHVWFCQRSVTGNIKRIIVWYCWVHMGCEGMYWY